MIHEHEYVGDMTVQFESNAPRAWRWSVVQETRWVNPPSGVPPIIFPAVVDSGFAMTERACRRRAARAVRREQQRRAYIAAHPPITEPAQGQ